jgi:prophage regulatory protein
MSIRKAMRLPAVVDATGYARPTIYKKIAAGKFPPPTKLDPEGRHAIWWADEIAALQRGEWFPDWKPQVVAA